MPLTSGTNQAAATILGPIGAPRLNRGALAPLGTTDPFSEVAKQAEESLENKRIIQAAEAAGATEIERDVNTGMAILPKSQGNFTIFDKNFNKAIRVKYLSELDRDTTKTLDGIFARHDRKEISLSVATKEASAFIKSLEDNVDPSVRTAAVERASNVARELTRPAQRKYSEGVVQDLIMEANRSVNEYIEDSITDSAFGLAEQEDLKKSITTRLNLVFPDRPEFVKSKVESAYASVLSGRWRHIPFKPGDIQSKRKFLDFLHTAGGPTSKSFTSELEKLRSEDSDLYNNLSNFHAGFEKLSYGNKNIVTASLEKQFLNEKQKQNDAANVGTLQWQHRAVVRRLESFELKYGIKVENDPLYKELQGRLEGGFGTLEDAKRAIGLMSMLTALQNNELQINKSQKEILLDRLEAVIDASHGANPVNHVGMTPDEFKKWRETHGEETGIADITQRIDAHVKMFSLRDKAANRAEKLNNKKALNSAALIKLRNLEEFANNAMRELALEDQKHYPDFGTFIRKELEENYPDFKQLPNHIKLSILKEEIGREFRAAHTKLSNAIKDGRTSYNHHRLRHSMLIIADRLNEVLPDHIRNVLNDPDLDDAIKTRILGSHLDSGAAERRAEIEFQEFKMSIANGDTPSPNKKNIGHATEMMQIVFPHLMKRGETGVSWLGDAVLKQTQEWKIVPSKVSNAINDLAGSGVIEDLKTAYRAHSFLSGDPNLSPSLDKNISKRIRDKFSHIKQHSNSDEAFLQANQNNVESNSGYLGTTNDLEEALAGLIKEKIGDNEWGLAGVLFDQAKVFLDPRLQSPSAQLSSGFFKTPGSATTTRPYPGVFLKRVKDYYHQFSAMNFPDHNDPEDIKRGLTHAWDVVSKEGGWSISKLDASVAFGKAGMIHRPPELALRDIEKSSDWVTPVLERFVNTHVLRVGAENTASKSDEEIVEGTLARQTLYKIENLRISRTNNDELKFRIFSIGKDNELVQLFKEGDRGGPPVPLVIDFSELKASRNQAINSQELELRIAKDEKAKHEAKQRQKLINKKRNPPRTSQDGSVRKGLDFEKQDMEKAIELGEDEIKLLEKEDSLFGLVNNAGDLSLRDESVHRAVRYYMRDGQSRSDDYHAHFEHLKNRGTAAHAFEKVQASRYSANKTVPLRPTTPEDLEKFRILQSEAEDQPFVWPALQEVSP